LAEDGGAVVVDFFAGEAGGTLWGWVEGIDTAEGKFDTASSGGKAAPGAEMGAADDDFDEDGFRGDVAALDVDLEIWQSLHELLVEVLDAVASCVVGIPGLVIVAGGVAEGGEDAGKVVGVFKADVLFDESDAGVEMVVGGRLRARCVRSWCAGHGCLQRFVGIGLSGVLSPEVRRRRHDQNLFKLIIGDLQHFAPCFGNRVASLVPR
jgi:hypothetical protein